MNKLPAMIAALAFSAASANAAIDIQEVESPMGIKAWLVEDHTIPFIAIEILFRGGTSIEPADKQGGTYLMTGLLEEGAGDFDAAEFQKRLETLAASFGFDSSKEALSVSAKFLTENRDESVELLRIALQEPRFDDEPLSAFGRRCWPSSPISRKIRTTLPEINSANCFSVIILTERAGRGQRNRFRQ